MTDETKPIESNLNADDLLAIQAVIELATRRGAFQANEISMVGQIFDKLRAFNEYVAKNAADKKEVVNEQ